MDLLIWLLIIAGIYTISKGKKNPKGEKRHAQQSHMSEQQRQMEMQRQHQREEEQRRREEERREKQRQMERHQAELRKAQQELSRKNKSQQIQQPQKSQPQQFQQSQKSKQPQANPGTYTKEDILARSSRDVDEDFGEDTLKREAGLHQGCVEGHYEQQSDLLKTVEDLMVLGPNCTISYERDFVGEGERMVETFK